MTLLLMLALAVPNPLLTPGVVRPLSTRTICQTKWSADRRHVTAAMKRTVLETYGLTWEERQGYEIDHLVPRELGGADDVRNLWPQPWPEARKKDATETALHKAVCRGAMRLTEAQDRFLTWGTDGGR